MLVVITTIEFEKVNCPLEPADSKSQRGGNILNLFRKASDFNRLRKTLIQAGSGWQDLETLRKNSDSSWVGKGTTPEAAEKLDLQEIREGHDFSCAVNSFKMCRASAPEVSFFPATRLFRNLFLEPLPFEDGGVCCIF